MLLQIEKENSTSSIKTLKRDEIESARKQHRLHEKSKYGSQKEYRYLDIEKKIDFEMVLIEGKNGKPNYFTYSSQIDHKIWQISGTYKQIGNAIVIRCSKVAASDEKMKQEIKQKFLGKDSSVIIAGDLLFLAENAGKTESLRLVPNPPERLVK